MVFFGPGDGEKPVREWKVVTPGRSRHAISTRGDRQRLHVQILPEGAGLMVFRASEAAAPGAQRVPQLPPIPFLVFVRHVVK